MSAEEIQLDRYKKFRSLVSTGSVVPGYHIAAVSGGWKP